MSKALKIGLGVAALAGLGVGVYAISRKRSGPVVSKSKPATPALDARSNPPGLAPGTGTSQAMEEAARKAAQEKADQDRLAAIQAELERQRVLAAQQQKEADIARLRGAAAGIENDQVLVLTRIRAVYDDNSRLNDFVQQAFDSGMSRSDVYGKLVKECDAKVTRDCGAYSWFNGCWNANMPKCYSKEIDYQWGNPPAGVMNWAKDLNNPESGPARLARWKLEQVKPLEAELARLEVQYVGVVRELKERFGVEFQSVKPEAHSYKPTA